MKDMLAIVVSMLSVIVSIGFFIANVRYIKSMEALEETKDANSTSG